MIYDLLFNCSPGTENGSRSKVIYTTRIYHEKVINNDAIILPRENIRNYSLPNYGQHISLYCPCWINQTYCKIINQINHIRYIYTEYCWKHVTGECVR